MDIIGGIISLIDDAWTTDEEKQELALKQQMEANKLKQLEADIKVRELQNQRMQQLLLFGGVVVAAGLIGFVAWKVTQ